MLSAFDHLTIAVADVETAIASYERLLGTKALWRGAHPGLGTAAALFGLSNGLIELVGPIADAAEAEGLRAHVAAHGEGLFGFTLGVDDAAASTPALRARGVRAAPPEEGEARAADGSMRRFRVVELSRASTRQVPVTLVERVDPLPVCEPAGASALGTLDHLVIRTADPEAALKLYRDGLGLRLALDQTFGTTRMLFFRIGGVTLEVVHDPARTAADALWGVAYRVGDLEAAHARLVAAGIAVSAPRSGRKPGTQVFGVRDGTCGVPTLVIRDPSRDRR